MSTSGRGRRQGRTRRASSYSSSPYQHGHGRFYDFKHHANRLAFDRRAQVAALAGGLGTAAALARRRGQKISPSLTKRMLTRSRNMFSRQKKRPSWRDSARSLFGKPKKPSRFTRFSNAFRSLSGRKQRKKSWF